MRVSLSNLMFVCASETRKNARTVVQRFISCMCGGTTLGLVAVNWRIAKSCRRSHWRQIFADKFRDLKKSSTVKSGVLTHNTVVSAAALPFYAKFSFCGT
jgi:hypothetical protein